MQVKPGTLISYQKHTYEKNLGFSKQMRFGFALIWTKWLTSENQLEFLSWMFRKENIKRTFSREKVKPCFL